MVGAIAFAYGMVTSFVLSGAAHNRRMQRPNPPLLQHLGYVCLGSSAAFSALLFAYAGYGLLAD